MSDLSISLLPQYIEPPAQAWNSPEGDPSVQIEASTDTFASSPAVNVLASSVTTESSGTAIMAHDPLSSSGRDATQPVDTISLLLLAGMLISGAIYGLWYINNSIKKRTQIPHDKLLQRIDSVSEQRSSSWTAFYLRRFGSMTPDVGQLEVSARKAFRSLPPQLRWSFALRDGVKGGIAIEEMPEADRLLPPIPFAEHYVNVDHGHGDDLAAREVESLDRLSALAEIGQSYDELERCFRVFNVLLGRLSADGRAAFNTEVQSSYPTYEHDHQEVLSRSHRIVDDYSAIIDCIRSKGRLGALDRVVSLLLAIKATHLVLRATTPEEHEGIARSAERAWKALPGDRQYAYKLMDMILGMKRVHEIEKNPAPFAVSWCFMWTWEKFFAQGRILCPIANPVAARPRTQDPRNFF